MTLLRQHFESTTIPSDALLFGRTQAMHDVRQHFLMVSRTDIPVLFQGESGTGKEVMVQALHRASSYRTGRLVKVNCPSIAPDKLEAAIFGKGAEASAPFDAGQYSSSIPMTTPSPAWTGSVEEAQGGTLFLDDIAGLNLSVQSRLLQLVQEGTFVRVGGRELCQVNTRLVLDSSGDLRQQVVDGVLSADFFHRFNVVTIHLPALRDRMDDFEDFVAFFLEKYRMEFCRIPPPISPALLRRMQSCNWPGNIRQLDNCVRSYVMTENEASLIPEKASPVPSHTEPLTMEIDFSQPLSLKNITRSATREMERQIILKVLQANNWNRQKTARWLQISYRSLMYKLNGIAQPAGRR